jgi:three-Cys-motif partner protein
LTKAVYFPSSSSASAKLAISFEEGPMDRESFFDEQTGQSIAKTAIVQKYFAAWVNAIKLTAKRWNSKIAYIDLFAGPGRYKKGAKSTPVEILERAIADSDMREMLITVFNDKDEQNLRSLELAISGIEGIDRLRFKPQLMNNEVGDKLVQQFEKINFIPTLFFIDPWGYKGLSLRLINSVLKDWGCDCIIFFNYNRINAGLNNDFVEPHLNELFGVERANKLRAKIVNKRSYERELHIVEEICEALKEMGGKYTLPFRFRSPQGKRTSHHLIFVSKHVLGYSIMKDIMAKESSSNDQGVPSFEYNPASKEQPLLYSLARPLEALANQLTTVFKGQTLTRDLEC